MSTLYAARRSTSCHSNDWELVPAWQAPYCTLRIIAPGDVRHVCIVCCAPISLLSQQWLNVGSNMLGIIPCITHHHWCDSRRLRVRIRFNMMGNIPCTTQHHWCQSWPQRLRVISNRMGMTPCITHHNWCQSWQQRLSVSSNMMGMIPCTRHHHWCESWQRRKLHSCWALPCQAASWPVRGV